MWAATLFIVLPQQPILLSTAPKAWSIYDVLLTTKTPRHRTTSDSGRQ